MKTVNFLFKQLVFVLCIALLATNAHAENEQQANIAEPKKSSAENNLKQLSPAITVKARSVKEQQIKLPFMIDVVDALEIENNSFTDLENLLFEVPTLEVNSYGGTSQTSLKIRGVGALNKVSFDDTSVVIYQNGAPLTMLDATATLVDIQAIEVLKGPQGTLYGRNSEAGVINIIPQPPKPNFAAKLGAEYGNYQHKKGEAILNMPLSEKLSTRLALSYKQAEHAYTNNINNKAVSEPQDIYARATIAYWGANNELMLTLSHEDKQKYGAVAALLDDEMTVTTPTDGSEDDAQTSVATINYRHDFSNYSLYSVSSFYQRETEFSAPFRDQRLNLHQYGRQIQSSRSLGGEMEHFYQELRIGSNERSEFFWTVGANLYRAKRETFFNKAFDNLPFFALNPFNADIEREFKTSSNAVFGEMTYPIIDALELTAGLRHNFDQVDYKANWQANPTYIVPGIRQQKDQQTHSEDYTTGRLGLSYALNENWHLYSMYARGQKAGGYSDWDTGIASGAAAVPYQAAIVNTLELGIKGELPQPAFSFNLATFMNNVKDDHVYVMLNPRVSFANIIENFDTKSQGAELNIDYQATDTLKLQTAIVYTDAKIKNQPTNSYSRGIKKDNLLTDVAPWVFKLAANYIQPANLPFAMGQGQLSGFIGYHYLGERAAVPNNMFNLKKHHQLNAKLGIANANLELYLWGNNLLNQHRQLYGYYLPATPIIQRGTGKDAHMGIAGKGTVYGIGANYYF